MAFNRREILACTSGREVGLRFRILSNSLSAPGFPERSHADFFAPRFAATSGACTRARFSGWRIRHFAEQDRPQNLASTDPDFPFGTNTVLHQAHSRGCVPDVISGL